MFNDLQAQIIETLKMNMMNFTNCLCEFIKCQNIDIDRYIR